MKPKRTKSLVGLWVGLGLMVISPLIGMVGTMIGMHHSFSTLGGNGIGNPNDLSRGIGTVLTSNMAAVGAGIIGLLIFVISLILYIVVGRSPEARP